MYGLWKNEGGWGLEPHELAVALDVAAAFGAYVDNALLTFDDDALVGGLRAFGGGLATPQWVHDATYGVDRVFMRDAVYVEIIMQMHM